MAAPPDSTVESGFARQYAAMSETELLALACSSFEEYPRRMATNHISEAEAVRDFSSLLARVRAGEEIVIEADASPVAILKPAGGVRGRLLSESLALARTHAMHSGGSPEMDAGFASDMERIVRGRRPSDRSAWD